MAGNAGLCVGVSRALNAADGLLDGSSGAGVFFWGPIIHNRIVIDKYVEKGARVIENYDEIPENGTVIIRAHGVTPETALKISESCGKLVDATCAHVRANQALVRKKVGEGCDIVICGDAGHPEVIGINGWAYNKAIIAGGADELLEKLGQESSSGVDCRIGRRICLLAQTTFNHESFMDIASAVTEKYPETEVYDTICRASVKRQDAAAELAGRRDAMIVVGSADSANAKQLLELCGGACREVYFIESAGGLPPIENLRGKRIGVTASASTPDWIIEEVIEKMEEMKRLDGDIDFAEEMESSLVTLQMGQTVKGRIMRYNSTEVYIDLGYKSDGVIPIEEFVTDAEQDPENNIKIDDIIEVYVVRVNDSEGTVQLSKKRVDEKNNWARIEEAFENASPVKAVVTDVTNGGLIVTSGGVRIFVPASQVSDRYVEDLRSYLRKPTEIRVIDYNKQKRKFVGSMKVLIIEDKRRAAERLWDEIEVAKEYGGTVKSLTAFGAFVDIGGVDGLVHISELSWNRIKHPSDVVKVGEQITVRVISLDRDKKKISLGYRRDEDNPWYNIEAKYPVGSVVTKKVVRIAPFGAFVELERGIDALVHISQISDTRIAKPDDVLYVGMEVTAKITELNLETKKISMSIKEVEPIPYIPPVTETERPIEPEEDELPTEHVEEMHTTLGDMLKSAAAVIESSAAETAEPDAGEPAAVVEESAPAATEEPAAAVTEPIKVAEIVEPVPILTEEPEPVEVADIKEPAAVVTEEPDAAVAEEPAAAVAEEPSTAVAEAAEVVVPAETAAVLTPAETAAVLVPTEATAVLIPTEAAAVLIPTEATVVEEPEPAEVSGSAGSTVTEPAVVDAEEPAVTAAETSGVGEVPETEI